MECAWKRASLWKGARNNRRHCSRIHSLIPLKTNICPNHVYLQHISKALTSEVLEMDHGGAIYPHTPTLTEQPSKISAKPSMKGLVTSAAPALDFGLAATALPLPSSSTEADRPTDALVLSLQYHAARRERGTSVKKPTQVHNEAPCPNPT